MPTETSILDDLQSKLSFPPFTIRVRKDMDFSALPPDQRPDAVLNIEFPENGSRDFALTYKSVGGLANLRVAIMSAQALAYASKHLLPLVVVPHLRPDALAELMRQRVSGLDLNGNGVLYAPGSWVGYRTGEKNQYPSTAPISSPYRGEQSIVCRALLAKRSFDSQSDMVRALEAFEIRASTVSKVLSVLAEDLIVRKKPRIILERPDILLDRLRENYRPPKILSTQRLRLIFTDTAKATMAANAAAARVWYAMSTPDVYTLAPSGDSTRPIFTTSAQNLMNGVSYEPDDRFPNIVLIETASRFPFFGRVNVDEFWRLSPLQEYLALSQQGKREREIAETLRPGLLVHSEAPNEWTS